MDPVSVIVLALVYAALRAPAEAGRAVRSDYRGRRGRWSARAEPWMNPRPGRERGGRRVAGYDRGARPYTRRDVRGRGGRQRGDAGWWRDPRAWRGPEGRARGARGVRPAAIRTGIVAGALGYTAVFALAVASRGFARGLRGGYRMGRLHYQGRRAMRTGPTTTVTPGASGDPADPNAQSFEGEVVDGEVVEPHESDAPKREALTPPAEQPPATEPQMPAGWEVTVFAPGSNQPVDQITVTDPDEVDARLAAIAHTPGLRAEIREVAQLPEDPRPDPAGASTEQAGVIVTHYEWQCPECGEPALEQPPHRWTAAYGPSPRFSHLDGEPLCPVIGADGYEPAQPAPRDTAPDHQDSRSDPAGPAATTENQGEPMPLSSARDVEQAVAGAQADPPVSVVARQVPLGAPVGASMLMEGANYDAHLYNLGFLLGQAQREYAAAELTLASAAATRRRAENDIAAAEQMAAALSSQDFGAEHVGNMAALQELLAAQVAAARAAHEAAFESTLANEHVIEVCITAESAFRRDHGQLAEAHAGAPHAARTREAYQD